MNRSLVATLLDPRIALPALVLRGSVIARCNRAARDLLGCEPGGRIEELFDRVSLDKLATARGAAPSSCELQALRPDREPLPIEATIVALEPEEQLVLISRTGPAYSAGAEPQLLALNDQLTNLARELSQRSSELDAARARFEALAELREHFVSMLAHDVKGPLQAIVLSADLISEDTSSEVTRKALARVSHSALRIRDIVDRVLEAARTETGRITLDLHPTSLREIVRETIEIYGPVAQRAGVAIELVDHAGPARVLGDRVRLGQVMGNLIENAIRHSPAGEVVTLELSQPPGLVRVAIRDRGPGIPAALRPRLFERFVQGSARSGSLGLGLYVARELVVLHGGRLIFEDGVPTGAAFFVELVAHESPASR